MLEKTLESPLDSKEIQPVHPKDQSWVFIGRTYVETETPVLWPPDVKSWPIWKDPDAWKDWKSEEKETTEDEMVGWHHWPNGHTFEQALGVGDGQGSLACFSPWGRKESDVTEQLNNKDPFTFSSKKKYTLVQICFPMGRHVCHRQRGKSQSRTPRRTWDLPSHLLTVWLLGRFHFLSLSNQMIPDLWKGAIFLHQLFNILIEYDVIATSKKKKCNYNDSFHNINSGHSPKSTHASNCWV